MKFTLFWVEWLLIMRIWILCQERITFMCCIYLKRLCVLQVLDIRTLCLYSWTQRFMYIFLLQPNYGLFDMGTWHQFTLPVRFEIVWVCLFSLQILFRFLFIVHKLLNSQTEFRNIVNAEDLDTSVFIFDCLLFPYFLFDVFSPFDPL